MSRLSLVVLLAWCKCAPDTLCGDKECPESLFCSLVLAGAVVGAPGADNLKIRPEFFPGGVGFCWFFVVLWLWILVRLWYVALESGGSFSMVQCAPDTLCGDKECPESPFCSLVLAGAVVGAPGADNLKIRPEFFPWGSGFQLVFWVLWLSILVRLRYVALESGGSFGMV
ncbi:hypothetical protein [Photobacterium salinisoli]|uniref:hypothetical protein n=1 Tax=Photobacterium salinisoli TaxID=1616783 RepID=UPI000EA03330|nr:hypothetical protein [Photobacterium salinisoli]